MKIKPVILCGGAGTRLWPQSEKNIPKQFVAWGGWTLFGKTLDRIKHSSFDYPVISTNIKYLKDIKKTAELYQSYAEVVETLKGDYLTAGDVNTFKEDLIECSKISKYVYGINVETSGPTSRGLFYAMKSTNKFINNNNDLKNVHVAISGVG